MLKNGFFLPVTPMADRWQAQYNFWSRFGIDAYEEHSVPDGAPFPYITYQTVTSNFSDSVSVSASIWTRSYSWETADSISDNIQEFLKDGGVLQPYDNGTIWITPNPTFSQSMNDPNDDVIKRKIISVTYHFN